MESAIAGVPQPAQVEEAQRLLVEYLPETQLVRAASIASRRGVPALLKLESELPTGSFKVRGALYALHCRLRTGTVHEVVASSTGNHGAAVAYAAKLLGVRATIFLPEQPNPVKRARIAELGASVLERGADLAGAYTAALGYASRDHIYFLNDATDPVLPAGPATIAVEILTRAPDVAQIVVPVGDTALIRGVAAAAKRMRPDIRIVGVQAKRAPAYALSWSAGRPVPTDRCDTMAEGLATRTPDATNVRAIQSLVDDFYLVSEDELLDAVRQLKRDENVVAEPAGAAALAGFHKLADVDGRTALLVTGGNITGDLLERALRPRAT